MKKKQKKWLFVKYKAEHPDKIPSARNKKNKKNWMKIIKAIVLFILFNLLAFLIVFIVSPEIRSLIF